MDASVVPAVSYLHWLREDHHNAEQVGGATGWLRAG